MDMFPPPRVGDSVMIWVQAMQEEQGRRPAVVGGPTDSGRPSTDRLIAHAASPRSAVAREAAIDLLPFCDAQHIDLTDP